MLARPSLALSARGKWARATQGRASGLDAERKRNHINNKVNEI